MLYRLQLVAVFDDEGAHAHAPIHFIDTSVIHCHVTLVAPVDTDKVAVVDNADYNNDSVITTVDQNCSTS